MEWLRKVAAWFHRADGGLAEELETHRALVEDELRRCGLTDDQAAVESRRRMGNVTLAREDARDVWSIRWLDRLGQHLRYGLRGLRREPLFAASALMTLALGTAATTTVFSVVDTELWRALPFPRSAELVALVSRNTETNINDGISLDELRAWRERATALSGIAASGGTGRRIAQLGYAESFITNEVTSEFFTTLGREAVLGRVFTINDATKGVAMLTERGWARVFARDPSALGRTFLLDDRPVTIVGIFASNDSLGPEAELYVPIDERSPSQASATFYSMIGRLAPGATLAAATQQVQGAIDDRAPVNPARRNHRAVVESLSTYYRTSNARPLYFFLGASLLVLLLTIANVAGLMVSRAVRRTPEFALRSAIGGGTRSLAAQLTAEGALVAVPGCALGLALAYAATRVLGQFVPDDFLIRGEHIPIDARVAGATLMVALITTASLTLVPLGIIRRVGERAALGAGHRTSDIPMAGRSRRILLTGQLAVTMTLLAGTGVFVKSYLELMQVPLGFEPANAWSIRIAMSGSRFERPESVRAYVESVSDRLRAVPGIQHVAAATSSPLLSGWLAMVTPASPPSPQAAGARVVLRSVGADYFRAAGTPIVRGRGFAGTDRPGAPAVAVINEELARRMFPDADPIGREIEFSAVRVATMGRGLATIVGIASDIKEIGLNEVRMADLYLPFEQRPSTSVELIARGQGVDAAMIAALRTAASDAVVPVITVGSLHSRVSRALQNERFHLMVVAAFAWLAVLTAGIGLYGAMAYAVTTRRREFGVRLALGASRRSLVGGTLLQSARLALVGGVAGLAAALLLARWIGDALYLVPGSHNGLLYNTNTTDPVALGVALAAILMLALLASAIPARRASRIDPAQALRAD